MRKLSIPHRWSVLEHQNSNVDNNYNNLATLNEYKFRSQENFKNLDWTSVGVSFGCSHTFGVAIEDTQTWPYQLSQMIDMKIINMGIPGASNDKIVRILYDFLKTYKQKPKSIFIAWSHKDRMERFHSDTAPYDVHPGIENPELYYKKYNQWDSLNNLSKNMLFAQTLLEKESIPFCFGFVENFLDYYKRWSDNDMEQFLTQLGIKNYALRNMHELVCDHAQDNSHAGPNTNKSFAEEIARIYNKVYVGQN